MNINLLVLRCEDLEAGRQFYELLGFSFIAEKHGKGPLHYSSQDAGFVFELYPLSKNETAGNSRLGFTVSDIGQVLARVPTEGGYEFNGRQIHIFRDPDGRKIELSEQQP